MSQILKDNHSIACVSSFRLGKMLWALSPSDLILKTEQQNIIQFQKFNWDNSTEEMESTIMVYSNDAISHLLLVIHCVGFFKEYF